ncbi:MAG: hypothetical protein QN178_14780 [Armatimonadota bacterium]|nr:hypothetical protein [Armatimonadota bacterium]
MAVVVLLGGLVWLRRTTDRLARACAVAILPTLAVATWLSPFESYSPGLVALYAALALLYLVDLREARLGGLGERGLLTLHLLLAAAGLAVVLDATLVDRVLVFGYSAFYPSLVPRMVLLQKPVLTFGTHSLAALLFYFLFLTAMAAHAARRSLPWLALIPTHLMLLILLRSTTSIVLAACATLALVARARRGSIWHGAALGLLLAAAVVGVVAAVGWSDRSIVGLLSYGLLGDERRGFVARFGDRGLLSSTIRYVSAHPWQPIGITHTDQLYLGDSGLLMTWLRGSLPLVVAVYFGLLRFFLMNLASATMAVWLWVVVVAAEIALVPLQYFRFVALLPLTVVALNTFESGCGAPQPELVGRGGPRA